jgi:hypothetical protein
MKNLSITLCLFYAIFCTAVISTQATAREVTLTTELQSYSGNGAYLAIYVTNAADQYQETLWVAGQKSKYYKHLTGWARASGLQASEYDGLTGASVTSGKTLTITLDLADAYIDAGFQLKIDTSVEDKRDNRNDIVVPLTTAGAGKPSTGRGYIKTFSYAF